MQDNRRIVEKGEVSFIFNFLVDCCVSLHATCHNRVQVLKKKPNVVPIQHNVKVVVAGAQMTTDSVAKEE